MINDCWVRITYRMSRVIYLPLGVAIDVDGYESEARWFCGREAEERLSG